MLRIKSTVCAIVILAMVGFVSGLVGERAYAAENKQLIAGLEKIQKTDKPFNIKIETATKKDTYKIGEKVSFLFTADRDCYLYILDIGTSGKAHILFPNKWQKANRAEKGQVYMVPPKGSKVAFKVLGPMGTNYVKAIATLKPVKSLDKEGVKKDGPFAELMNPLETFKDIGAELEQSKDWTEAEISIKIVK